MEFCVVQMSGKIQHETRYQMINQKKTTCDPLLYEIVDLQLEWGAMISVPSRNVVIH